MCSVSRIRLCLRISAGVLGALVALSPPAGAGGSAANGIASLRAAALEAGASTAGKKSVPHYTSGIVTTSTRKLDLSKFDLEDFGDVAR